MDGNDPLRDPIVDEVRQIRLEIDRQHGSSFEAYSAHLRQLQAAYGDRLVRRDPRPRVRDLRRSG